MNFPQDITNLLSTFLGTTTNDDLIRDYCRRGRAANGKGTVIMKAGPIEMVWTVDTTGSGRPMFQLSMFVDDASFSMSLRRDGSGRDWMAGVSDDGIIRRLRRFASEFLDAALLGDNDYTVESWDELDVPDAEVTAWNYDPASVTSVQIRA